MKIRKIAAISLLVFGTLAANDVAPSNSELEAMYEQLGGSDRVSVSIKEIVKAAHDGRVLYLFAAQGAQHMGNFDEMTHKVRTHGQERPGDEDLINAAVMQTLAHAGDVFIVARNKVPHGSQMAAVTRY